MIIPAHNRESRIELSVASALNQRPQPPAQVIVVDDASTDRTADRARGAGADVVRLERNEGAASARNAGIEASRQPWIAFLDSDDQWLSHHLATVWAARQPGAVIAAGAVTMDAEGRIGRILGSVSEGGATICSAGDVLFPENPVPMSATMMERSVPLSVGGFDPSIRYSEDLDLWLRLIGDQSVPICLLGEITVVYHLHQGQKGVASPQLFESHAKMIERCRSKPWWEERFAEKRASAARWDQFRRALSDRAWGKSASQGMRLVMRPANWLALVELWEHRRKVRRRTSSISEGLASSLHPLVDRG